MNATMTIWQKLIVGTVAGVLWLGAIIAKHFWPDIDTALFVVTCAAVIGALGIHGVTASGTQAAPAQGGFIAWGLMPWIMLCAIGAAVLTAGCTTTTASIYSGMYTQAKAGVQTFDDNTLATMHDLICAQPYSAIQRHPEMQAGIVTLCGPLTNTKAIDPAQVQSILDLGKQLGLTVAPASIAK